MHREVDGYITDVASNYGYRDELSPTLLRLLAESQGALLPVSRPLRYLELGCGTGVSLNIHAAACPGEYWGADINPLHVASTRALAEAAGTHVHTLDQSFADLLQRKDLPQFDVIVAHGVWSWVSEGNRTIIVELLRRLLADGGVYCMNWLAMPGAVAGLPLKRLMRVQKERARPGTSDWIRSGISLAMTLQAAGSDHFSPSSPAGRFLNWLEQSDANSLAHEFPGEHWQPALFAETAARVSEGGLRYGCSALLRHNYEELRFTPAQRAILDSIDDPWLRETVKDFLRERRQRVDIFIKGGPRMAPSRRPQFARDRRFILAVSSTAAVQDEISTAAGALRFSEAPFRQIIDRLAMDGYRPKTLDELMSGELPGAEMEDQFVRSVIVLVSTGTVHPVATESPTAEAIGTCTSLNDEILRRIVAPDRIAAMASPVTGDGVVLSRVDQLCLLATNQGAQSADQRGKFAVEAYQRAFPSAAKADVLKEVLRFETRLPALAALGLIRRPTSTVGEEIGQ